ncbi:MAG: SMP-30/gluconolactonase/LRE family protein [Deltaproteobacteria bacterium]|nr:SMP-30/gluconolactonase/LRE family protein [Deltaproteobacteria bacterium]
MTTLEHTLSFPRLLLLLALSASLAACGTEPDAGEKDVGASGDVVGDVVDDGSPADATVVDVKQNVDVSTPDAVLDAAADVEDAGAAKTCDEGCTGATPFCDGAAGVCVACLDTADCGKPGQRCIAHACEDAEPCTTDKTCIAKGGVCDLGVGVCVDCLADADCGDALACVAKVCLPPPASCQSSKDCAALDQVCNKAAGVCVDCEADVDCPQDRYCKAGLCLPDVCTGGEKTCVDLTTVGLCDESGAAFTASPCGTGSACKDGSCLAVICTAGATRCEAGGPETCDDLGVVWLKGEACKQGEACKEGACVATVCEPGASQCAGEALLTCEADGLSWASAACKAASGTDLGEGCVTTDGKASCKSKLCKPGTAVCAGETVATCKADGFDYESGEDCASKTGSEAGFACVEGACLALKCVPGSKSCAGAGVQTCNAAGDGWSGVDCGSGEGCKDGACKKLSCVANKLDCVGSKVRQCDASGTTPTFLEDCAATEKACVDGACIPWVCKPGSKECSKDGGAVAVCLPSGLGYDQQGCAPGKVCEQDGCVPVVCTAGKAFCDGSGKAMQCNALGTSATQLASCEGGKVCQDGACTSPICTPGEVKCQGLSTLETCNSSGIAWVQTTCPSGSACDAAVCKAQTCSPNAAICKGSEVHSCDAKGIEFSKSLDCAAANKVCKDGGCETPICKPGEKACVDGQPATCAADGLAWQKSQCGNGQVCKAGGCADVICTAGAKGCSGETTQVCDPTGTAWIGGTDCSKTGELCSEGGCTKPICEKDATRCEAGVKETCEGPLAGWKQSPCKTDEVCKGAGVCAPKLCTPDTVYCLGTELTKCSTDGTGQSLVADCGKTDQVCTAAGCKTPVCDKGSKKCSSGDLLVCATDQLSWQTQPCGSDATCVGAECKALVCKLGDKQCSGGKVQACASYGTAWSDVGDCAAAGKVCQAGACVDKLCEPGATSCAGDLLETCNADALSTTKSSCASGSICDGKSCQKVVCQAGQAYCDTNAVYTCNAKGTAGSKAKDCGSGETCKAGACEKTFCVANAKVCAYPSTAAICAPDGSKYSYVQCKSGELCYQGSCVYQACTVGSIGCTGSNAWKCHESGGYYVETAKCANAGKGCKDGICVEASCTPGEKACVGAAVGTCRLDATGYDLSPCGDNDACTPDSCKDAACVYGASKVCDDSNTCTTDSCDSKTGACVFAAKSGSCDDGTVCSKGDKCISGTCTATPGGLVTTIAGSGTSGYQDGAATSAKFGLPAGMVLDSDGSSILVADANNHRIRRLTSAGVVETYAGSGTQGHQDGALSSARFSAPHDLCWAGDGKLYVADRSNHRIRVIDPAAGTIAPFYGNGSTTYLYYPTGIAWHAGAGSIVVADSSSRVVRLITLDGKATVLAGSPGQSGSTDGTGAAARFHSPSGVAVDGDGVIWVADTGNQRIRRVTLDGAVTTLFGNGSAADVDGAVSVATIRNPYRILAGPSGLIIGSERRIRRVVGEEVFTIAGGDSTGFVDGDGASARVYNVYGLLRLADGSLRFSDYGNNRLRAVALNLVECDDGKPCTKDVCDSKTGTCTYTPLAAGAACSDGLLCTKNDACDAQGTCAGKATVCDDSNVCTDDSCDAGSGECLFAPNTGSCDDGDKCTDLDRCELGKCVPGFDLLSTVAGSSSGNVDGKGTAAKFADTYDVTLDGAGLAWIADSANHTIRTMDKDGNVATVAGGVKGLLDGPLDKARFNTPFAVEADRIGRIYVSDYGNHRIRRLDASKTVSTFAGSVSGYLDGSGEQAQFKSQMGITLCPDGALVVADTGNQRIRMVAPDGKVTTIAGSGTAAFVDGAGSSAGFSSPGDVACSADAIYVADTGNRRIRKIIGGQVTTVAGSGSNGAQDGPGTSASFGSPRFLSLRSDGMLFIADETNHRVRSLSPEGTVATLVGTGSNSSNDGAANVATISYPRGLVVMPDGGLLLGDGGSKRMRRLQRTAVYCEDGDACGKDSCDSKTGACVHTAVNVGKSCDDGTACTASSACSSAGVCAGTAKSCDDGNSCSVDLCDPTDGTCLHPTPFKVCDDGDACTSGEVCWAGTCGSKTPVVSTVAGKVGTSGDLDGDVGTGTMNTSYGMAFAGDLLYFSSYGGHRIRTWDRKTGKLATVAGNGSAGYTDGDAATARFNAPWGVAVVGSQVWIADTSNHRVRKLEGGTVSTPAGNGSAGYADGAGWQARFNTPRGLVHDGHGRLVVADAGNHRLRRVLADGTVSTLCGDGTAGYADGPAASAQLHTPGAVAYDGKGNLVFLDTGALRLRRLSADGKVTTLAGSGSGGWEDGPASSAKLGSCWGYLARPDGSVWMPMSYSGLSGIRELREGKVTTLTESAAGHYDGILPYSQWSTAAAAAVGPDGATYVMDSGNRVLRKIAGGPVFCDDGDPCTVDACAAASGACSHTPALAGASCDDADACTTNDACASGGCKGTAKDCNDGKVCTDDGCDPLSGLCSHLDNIAACDDGKVCTEGERCWEGSCHTSAGLVLPLAGANASGTVDDTGELARFKNVYDLDRAPDGKLWFADISSHRIGTITEAGVVTTVVGGNAAVVDGPLADARTSGPRALCATYGGVRFFDNSFRSFRSIVGGKVSTIAGDGSNGYLDGPGLQARFGSGENGIDCVDATGEAFVADYSNHRIRVIAADAKVSTLAGSGTAGFVDGPGSSARFNSPRDVAIGADGNLYVADRGNYRIRKVTQDGTVTTVAGSGQSGFVDGAGTSAQFGTTNDIVADASGRLFVTDVSARRLRMIDAGLVSTLAGSGTNARTVGPASSASLASPRGLSLGAGGDLFLGDVVVVRRIVGLFPACEDGNPCTVGSCDAQTGCKQSPAPDGMPCAEDGKLCEVGRACSSGSCSAGTAMTCADKNECTIDSCDGKTGLCVFAPIAGCTPAVVCGNGVLQTGEECDDGNEVDDDACSNQCKVQLLTGSTIATSEDAKALAALIPDGPGTFELCYRKSVDGASAATWHSKCDGYASSLVLMSTSGGAKRVAGYLPTKTSGGGYQAGTGGFLTRLGSGVVHTGGNSSAQYNSPSYGPTWGNGHDLHVKSNMTTGYSQLGYAYDCVVGTKGSATCQSQLFGVYNSWSLSELEVWGRVK